MSKTITINPELFKIGKTKKNKPIKPAVSPKMIKRTLIKRIKEHRKKEKIFEKTENKVKDDFFDSESYLNNILKKKEPDKKNTIKNYAPVNNYEMEPIKKEVENIIFKPSDEKLNLNYKIDNVVGHGCLKNGIKQCYRSWKSLKQPIVHQAPKFEKAYDEKDEVKNIIVSEINKAINSKTEFSTNLLEKYNREDKPLVISDEDIKIETEELEPKAVEPVEPKVEVEKVEIKELAETEINPDVEETPVKVTRTTKRKYSVGKNKNGVGVIIPGKKTRKKMIENAKDLKKVTNDEMKKILRTKGLIKVGSSAPSEIVRKIFENIQLAGNIINEDKDVLLHNLLNSDSAE